MHCRARQIWKRPIAWSRRPAALLARIVDVRDQAGLDLLVADAVAGFGHLDIVSANAGIVSFRPTWELSDAEWANVLDVNLTGVFHTVRAVIPTMIAQATAARSC